VRDGKTLAILAGHTDRVVGVVFSPGSTRSSADGDAMRRTALPVVGCCNR